MPVLIKIYKNNNDKSAAYGKHYAKTVTTGTMTYKELTKHMSEHNTVYGEDVCSGVAIKLQNCILEQLLEGKKVQFGDLGTFYLAVKTTGATKEEDFNVGTNIKGLSSKTLKKRATFMNVKELIESKKASPNSDSESDDNNG